MKIRKLRSINLWSRLKPFFQIIRPVNLLIIALTAFLSWYAVIGSVLDYFSMSLHMSVQTVIIVIGSIVCIAAGGYVINDYFDVEIDKINKPEKPIIVGALPRRRVWIIYIVLTVLGLILGFWASVTIGNYQIGMLHIVFAMALYFYSEQYKYIKFWGNFLISISTAFVIITMWLFEFFAMIRDLEFLPPFENQLMNTLVLGYAGFAFLSTFARELIKDRQDVTGDLKAGARTLAVTMSEQGFKSLVYIMLLLNISFLIVAQLFLYQIKLVLLSWYVFVLEIILLYVAWLLNKARMQQDYANISLYMKGYIVAGVLSMQIMSISW
ncbi:MAG: geranylgeranylglycerol-phosphate geranylgeranyltransferase [Bacteroidales bacterium]